MAADLEAPTTSAIHGARAETEEMIAKSEAPQGEETPRLMLVPLTHALKLEAYKEGRSLRDQRFRRALIYAGLLMILLGALLVVFGPWTESWPNLYWQRSVKCEGQRDACKEEKEIPRICDVSFECDPNAEHVNKTKWDLRFPKGCCKYQEYFRGNPSCYSTPACQTFLPYTIAGGVLLMAGLLSIAMARRPAPKSNSSHGRKRRKSRLNAPPTL
jgi:hypothetical protein